MASYTASFNKLEVNSEFGWATRYYKITSTTSVPALNVDFTVTFPYLSSSQYNSSSDTCYLGFGSSGTYGQYRITNVPEGQEGTIGTGGQIPISGGTYSLRKVSYYDVITGTGYDYNFSSNYSQPPTISGVSLDTSYPGTITTTCDCNWGKSVSGTIDCVISYTLDGVSYSYSCYTKKFTNGYNLSFYPSSSSQWKNYTPSSSQLSRNYQISLNVVDIFGSNYYKGTNKYWDVFPEGTNVTATWVLQTTEGTASKAVLQYAPTLWEIVIVDTEHQGGSLTPPDSVKSAGIRQPSGVISEFRRFRLIE